MTQDDESGTSGYVVSASSYYESNSTYAPWKAFDGIEDGNSWLSQNLSYNADGTAIGATAVDTFESIAGSWLGIELPNKIKLEYVSIKNRNSDTIRNVKDGIIWARNDGTTWFRIKDFSGLNTNRNAKNAIQVHQTIAYNEYRLQFTKIYPYVGGGAASIGELAFFGTPEYDPEAHGTDVTVKSYPNVPNTDWLEVYYDAKDYTTMPNPVTDLAGGDQDASVYGVTLDTTNEAFVFNGSSYLETDIPQITTGVWPFTMSFWFKVNAHIGSTWNYLAHLGVKSGNPGDSTLVGLQNDLIAITTWGDSKINSSVVATPGVWYHVTSTWPGGPFYDNAKLYINAVSYGDVSGTRDETYPLSFPTSGNKLTLGKQMNTTSDYFDGSIANFRLFNRALTTDEIYQLYAYQKEYFGHGDLYMTLKAGRLGIGTSEPRAALDVRGGIYANGSQSWPIPTAHFYKASPGTSSTAHYENLDTGRVDLDNTLRDAPGIIERVVLTSSAPVVTTNGTTGGVIKFCKPGNYHVSVGIGVAKQYTHSLGFDLVFIQVGTEGKLSIGKTNNSSYGGAVVDGDKNYPMGYRRTFLVNVSNAPTYGSIYVQPSSNNGNLFRFETYGATSLAHADVYYLG